ncbi:hypothetical protein AO380_1316 [Moraxella catarrhalis]|nr:hypothetical protein AO380_1316 [Moraxella catarrhalis]
MLSWTSDWWLVSADLSDDLPEDLVGFDQSPNKSPQTAMHSLQILASLPAMSF